MCHPLLFVLLFYFRHYIFCSGNRPALNLLNIFCLKPYSNFSVFYLLEKSAFQVYLQTRLLLSHDLIYYRIGHDNSGLFGSSWFLDRVEVESKLLGKMWHFPFHQWLSKEKHGCKPEVELFPHQIVNGIYETESLKYGT